MRNVNLLLGILLVGFLQLTTFLTMFYNIG